MLAAIALMTVSTVCPVQSESPSQIISKMLAKYAYAEQLSGTIVQTYSDGGGKVTIKTKVNYIRPSLLFIEQDRKGKNGLNHQAISDGVLFMYHPPINAQVAPLPNERLFEPLSGMLPGTGTRFQHDVGYLYNIAHMSLAPSNALDIAIGYLPHLRDLNIHIRRLDPLATAEYKKKPVHRITGDWAHNASSGKAGIFEMLISPEYDLLRLAHTAQYNTGQIQAGTDNVNPGNVVTLTTTEEVSLSVDAKVDKKVFDYRKKGK